MSTFSSVSSLSALPGDVAQLCSRKSSGGIDSLTPSCQSQAPRPPGLAAAESLSSAVPSCYFFYHVYSILHISPQRKYIYFPSRAGIIFPRSVQGRLSERICFRLEKKEKSLLSHRKFGLKSKPCITLGGRDTLFCASSNKL